MFGVKSSLIVDVPKITDEAVAKEYGMNVGDWEITYDFVMVNNEEAKQLKEKLALEALKKLGSTATVVAGLPVADVD